MKKNNENKIRLQKIIANAGIASRRAAEILISEGRVSVDGKLITEQGVKVDPDKNIIRVDGERIKLPSKHTYISYYKPEGIYSTMKDEDGRISVGNVIEDKNIANQGIFHVGRLDADSEGLLLLTNDGELGNRLMHPSYEIEKEYLVTIKGKAKNSDLIKLTSGFDLDDGFSKFKKVEIVDYYEGVTILKIIITEGKNRIIRRMLKEIGFDVQRLVRIRIASIKLENQKINSFRYLNEGDVKKLYKQIGL